MATTTTMMVATNLTLSATHCCPQCGFDIGLPPLADDTQAALLDAQQQIADLQAQVRLLNEKASAAVDRWADYEDEVAKLRAELDASRRSSQQQSPTAASTTSSSYTAPTVSTPGPSGGSSVSSASPARSSFLSGGAASRLSALLSPRKSTPNLKPQPSARPAHPLAIPPNHSPDNSTTNLLSPSPFSPATTPPAGQNEQDLLEALTREQTLRIEAEGRLSATSREVEELSVSLFEQANEMVASERRARAQLEQRVEMLEKRDRDKKRRLERLESAMERIERVRALLGQDGHSLLGEREISTAAAVEGGGGSV
ncbi:putative ribosomal protein l32 protein [Echria macrotheca]|uniref:Ribosomal protein l32 protein n=1 Tax=Echria macrotheca TaxID=438768 RepID=A0AAJ0FGC6_9PEZI|nr:putative ribosomal protein l32 protein [Echria macrotheca]